MASANDVDGVDAKEGKSGDSKKKRGPLGAIRSLKKLFTGSGRRRKSSHQEGVVYKAKSTSELLDVGRSGSEDGSGTSLSVKALSVSADNVFRQSLGSDPGPYTDDQPSTSRPLRPQTSAGFGKELSLLLQKRGPGVKTDDEDDDDDDETFPASSSRGKERLSDGSDTRRMSADSSDVEMENPKDFFQSNWGVSSTQVNNETITPVDSKSLDLNSIPQTSRVNHDLQRHKLAVKQKGKRASSAFIAKHSVPIITVNEKLEEEDEEEEEETVKDGQASPLPPSPAEKKAPEVVTKQEEVAPEEKDKESLQSPRVEVATKTKPISIPRTSVKSESEEEKHSKEELPSPSVEITAKAKPISLPRKSAKSESEEEKDSKEKLPSPSVEVTTRAKPISPLRKSVKSDSSDTNDEKEPEEKPAQETSKRSSLIEPVVLRGTSERQTRKSESDKDETTELSKMLSKFQKRNSQKLDDDDVEAKLKSLTRDAKSPTAETLPVETRGRSLSTPSRDSDELTQIDLSNSSGQKENVTPDEESTTKVASLASRMQRLTANAGSDESNKVSSGISKSQSLKVKSGSPSGQFKRDSPINKDRLRSKTLPESKESTKMHIISKNQQEENKSMSDVPAAPLSERRQLGSNEPSQFKTPVSITTSKTVSQTSTTSKTGVSVTSKTTVVPSKTVVTSKATAVSSATSVGPKPAVAKPTAVSSKSLVFSSRATVVSSKPGVISKPAVTSLTVTTAPKTTDSSKAPTVSSAATTVSSKATTVSSVSSTATSKTTASATFTKPITITTTSKSNTQKPKTPSVSSTTPTSPLDNSSPSTSPTDTSAPEKSSVSRGSLRSKAPTQNTQQSSSDPPPWMALAKSKTAKFNQAQQVKPEAEAKEHNTGGGGDSANRGSVFDMIKNLEKIQAS